MADRPQMFGPIRLASQVRTRHAVAFVVVAIASISMVVFLNFMQPYLLHGQIQVAPGVLGRLTSRLSIMQELLVLVCVSPLGALSDRVGRHVVFATGLVIVSVALGLYSLITSIGGLYAARFLFACGCAATTATLATVAADYPDNRDRGKFLGFLLVTQQIAILGLVANLAAKAPHWLVARGMDRVLAGQVTFRATAVVGLLGGLLAYLGLKRKAPTAPSGRVSVVGAISQLFGSLGEIVVHVRREPRFMIVLGVAFLARGDAAIMTTFLSLWTLKTATAGGVDAARALATAGGLLSAVTFSGMASACLIGWGADRFNRLAVLTAALAVAGAGNIAIITIRGFAHWPVYALVALIAGAETAVIVCGQAVLGEQAPPNLRGAAIGAFSVCGSIGVLTLVYVGGVLFDKVSAQAPFVMLGCVNIVASLAAAYVWLKPDALRSRNATV